MSYLDEPLRDVLKRWNAYISTEIQKLITVDCIVQEDPDNWKEKTVSILEDGQEIGEYTIYYYTDDSDAVYFTPIINGEEKKSRELSGPYQPYAYGAKSIRESIIRDLEKMGYRIEDAERKLAAIW